MPQVEDQRVLTLADLSTYVANCRFLRDIQVHPSVSRRRHFAIICWPDTACAFIARQA